jgi:hypothetical protein
MFWRKLRLHFHGQLDQARNQYEENIQQQVSSACCLLYAGFLLGLLANLADGGGMFL